MRQGECEAASGFSLPFIQEFEFVPVAGKLPGRWRELEVVAWRDEQQLKLWFEVDRQQRGLEGMLAGLLGRGELKRHLEIPVDSTPEAVGEQVLDFLAQNTWPIIGNQSFAPPYRGQASVTDVRL